MAGQALCFINYRRVDGGHAGRLKDRLAAHYEPRHLFFDSGSIDCGDNIPDALMQGIQAANVMLVVIGTNWLASLVQNHAENKTDWVKIEIAAALQRQANGEAIAIIPVLVGGATMPDINHLPDAAQEIAGLFLLEAFSLGVMDYELEGQFKYLLRLLERYGMPPSAHSTSLTEAAPSAAGTSGYGMGANKSHLLSWGLAVTAIATLSLAALGASDWKPGIAIGLAILLSAMALWFAIYRIWGDRSIAGRHNQSISAIFPAKSFAGERDSFCKTLGDQISKLDRETNWNPDHYAELEAEVEIIDDVGMTLRRSRSDLQSAIRSDRKTRAFLVLGDPGAGKSVALRKLTRDMLAQVHKTGRIPIYVNLREWLPHDGRARRWTEQRKPTMDELKAFVIASITRDDSVMAKFVARYFDPLREHGHLFFIFDSFDEIPQLLDVDGETWLIDSLSDLLYRFIASGQQARGVLASRFFRRPTQSFLAQRILSVKPLTEERILQALGRVPGFGEERQKALFRDRLDLVPIVRNPFLMSLLSEWMQHNGDFPATQAELYESFLLHRLEQREDLKSNKGLTTGEVFRCAQDVAWFVFNSPNYGLEAPVQVISEAGINKNVDQVMAILRAARVARVTDGALKSFSFVHRRFLEYFVTKRLLDHPDAAPVDHIPTDSRGRDSLVLYAQLCDDETAKKLALLCWSEIQAHFGEQATRLRAVHCLRFLTDAFGARPMAVESFSKELGEFIYRHVAQGENLVLAKICLEATGLLQHRESLPIFEKAMESNNSWIQETAFRACRHIALLSPDLKWTILKYIATMSAWRFLKNYRRLVFSLSLSESLNIGWRFAQFRRFNIILNFIFVPLSVLLFSSNYIFVFLLTIVIYFWMVALFFTAIFGGWKNKNFRKINLLFLKFFKIQSLLIIWPITLALISIEPLLSTKKGGTDFTLTTINYIFGANTIPEKISYFTMLIFSALIVDYVKLFIKIGLYFRRDWLAALTNLKNWIIATVTEITIGGIGIFALLTPIFLINLYESKNPNNTFSSPLRTGLIYLMLAFILFSLLMTIWRIINSIHEKFDDRRTFKKIDITMRMQRSKIAEYFLRLRAPHWRLKFVRQLAEKKVIAIGEWPPDFHLAVSDDQAITELAILEERWLKLDR